MDLKDLSAPSEKDQPEQKVVVKSSCSAATSAVFSWLCSYIIYPLFKSSISTLHFTCYDDPD